jgi:hypothetical protein
MKLTHYRLFFYSADRDEPAHVHVEREEGKAKFWLEPVRLEKAAASAAWRSDESNNWSRRTRIFC